MLKISVHEFNELDWSITEICHHVLANKAIYVYGLDYEKLFFLYTNSEDITFIMETEWNHRFKEFWQTPGVFAVIN